MKIPLLLGLALLAVFCGGKPDPVSSRKIKGTWQDTMSLSIDSVTINGLRTDTLSAAFDSALCGTLATVRIYLSDMPRTNVLDDCNLVRFDNGGNDRYVCYECLTFPVCGDGDSAHVQLKDTIYSKVVVDTIIADTVVSYDTVLFDDTAAIMTLWLLERPELGLDMGRAEVLLDSMYDRIVTDTALFDTAFFLYW